MDNEKLRPENWKKTTENGKHRMGNGKQTMKSGRRTLEIKTYWVFDRLYTKLMNLIRALLVLVFMSISPKKIFTIFSVRALKQSWPS